MIAKNYLFFGLVLLSSTLIAIQPDQVVSGASYVIYTEQDMLGGHSFSPHLKQKALFYTFDGQLLKTVDVTAHNWQQLPFFIDPSAPKPQPKYYKINYWPAYSIPIFWGLSKVVKGVPGYCICFYDKHGHCMRSYRVPLSSGERAIEKDDKNTREVYEKLSLGQLMKLTAHCWNFVGNNADLLDLSICTKW